MSVNKQHSIFNLIGWLVAAAATAVYLLTLEPGVSFWDCGEFIATSYKLQIGHPPGAPLYTLLAHCFTLLSGGNTAAVAWWSNALSAVAGGVTAMFLFWTIARLIGQFKSPQVVCFDASTVIPSLVGTGCYVFCDTAWFSAVESEVYSLSMLFSSAIVWAMVRWWQSYDTNAPRWLLLVSLLLGLSVGVHQLSLLTLPAIILIVILKKKPRHIPVSCIPHLVFFFLVGLTPYLVIPIRAAADPPINMGDPSSWERFKSYVSRDQYEKAPLLYGRCFNSPVVAYEENKAVYAPEMDMLFPRMWKHHDHAEQFYTDWTGRHGKMVKVGNKEYYKPSFGDNLVFFGGYQLGYMYLRYFMWNYAGRYNDLQGFGSLQNGQFITGIPFIDRLYIGSGRNLPDSMPQAGHNRYFLLPLLLGLVGVFAHFRREKKGAWMVMTVFLMSSVVLSVYLNHPVYEPRERDYAYILSFYAFAVWIGVGAYALAQRVSVGRFPFSAVLLLVPFLMACQNWDDHDRSGRRIAHDSAVNLLNSCGPGAVLFTSGDNDTFPLWYVQQVEEIRTDVEVVNISLLGSNNYAFSVARRLRLPEGCLAGMGPYGRLNTIIGMRYASASTSDKGVMPSIYFSQYAFDANSERYAGRLQPCGIAYQFVPEPLPKDNRQHYALLANTIRWSPLEGVYIDETSYSFLRQYWKDVLDLADSMFQSPDSGDQTQAVAALIDTASSQVPVDLLRELPLRYRVVQTCRAAGQTEKSETLLGQLRRDLSEQLDYYGRFSPAMRSYIPYTIAPLVQLQEELASE